MKYRKFLFIFISFFILFQLPSIASGGGSGLNPDYFPGGDYTQDSTFGVPSYHQWVCAIIYRLTFWLPSTPNHLTLSSLSINLGDNLPFIGAGIWYETMNIVKTVLILVASWKVFKSLPGKF